MEKAYDYYKNKKVPMPYDLYILLTDEDDYDNYEIKRCKEFDVNYNYNRMLDESNYKLEDIDYMDFFDFDNTKKWKVYLNKNI